MSFFPVLYLFKFEPSLLQLVRNCVLCPECRLSLCWFFLVDVLILTLPCSQLHMFQQLMETAPEVLQALGLRPESLQQEIANMQNMDKLKVLLLFILRKRHSI